MIKFRASSVGNLLVGGNAMTDKQRQRLQELLDRQNDPNSRALTKRMEEERDELITKRDAPFEFGATATSYIRSVWLSREFGYEEPVVTAELLKGIECEQEAIDVVSRQIPGPKRRKNTQQFENDWFTGEPDVILADTVEDVKCSWTLRTYAEVQHPSSLYNAQGQVYMDLTGRDLFRLCYVLLPTPGHLVTEEQRSFYYKFQCNEDDPRCQDAYRKVQSMHDVAFIPESQRVKYFEIKREDMYIEKLRKRVEQAQEVYDSMTL